MKLYNTDCIGSPRNGNVEMPVCFLKPKQGYTVRKMAKMCIVFTDKERKVKAVPQHTYGGTGGEDLV
jgi:hypothetical protein